jgi:hypothetical protein
MRRIAHSLILYRLRDLSRRRFFARLERGGFGFLSRLPALLLRHRAFVSKFAVHLASSLFILYSRRQRSDRLRAVIVPARRVASSSSSVVASWRRRRIQRARIARRGQCAGARERTR